MNEEKRRILVVDDEPDMTLLFKMALESEGSFIVSTFNDPLIALSNFKAGLYDLIILDIKMPKMDGFDLYQEIKKIDILYIQKKLKKESHLTDKIRVKK